MIKDKNFNGKRVFIALRTGMYSHHPCGENEHITVEYIGDRPTWIELITKLNYWKDHLYTPIQVHVNGYATWRAAGVLYSVALVNFPDKPELDEMKHWHITLEKSDDFVMPIAMTDWDDKNLYEVVDDLSVGYKDHEGKMQWLTAEGIHRMHKGNMDAIPYL